MKDGDYIVGINDEDVKWSPHDQVVNLIKRSGNCLKLRLVTPLDKKESHKISDNNSSALKIRGSSSPTSSASSTSGHSSGGISAGLNGPSSFSQPSAGELSSSPASSVTSGSTRSHHGHKDEKSKTSTTTQSNGNWNPFKKGSNHHQLNKPLYHINDNIILR